MAGLGADDAETIASSADELGGTFMALEQKLLQLKITGTGQDRVRWPTMLAGHLAYLASAVAVADFPPTDQHREVHLVLKGRLSEYERELDRLLQNVLPAFNQMLEEQNLPRLFTGRGPVTENN